MSQPVPHRRVIAEPRLVLLALIAVAVGVLCIVALADTDYICIPAHKSVLTAPLGIVSAFSVPAVLPPPGHGDE